jgi:maleamate amidohydrolase
MTLADVYDTAGFGGSVQRGRRPAIVVVDFTRGFTEPDFPTGADMTPAVTATADLVAAGRARGVPVIWTAIAYGSPAEGAVWHQKSRGMAGLRIGTPAVQLDPRLPVADSDPLIVKHGASAFFGTPLAGILTGLGVDTVLVCGATTSGCVRATVVDAVQSGFPVLVPRGCVADRADAPHLASLFDLQAKYADVIEVDDAITYLGSVGSAGPVPTSVRGTAAPIEEPS